MSFLDFITIIKLKIDKLLHLISKNKCILEMRSFCLNSHQMLKIAQKTLNYYFFISYKHLLKKFTQI